MRLSISPQRILDFDAENRPLSYLGNDFTTPELTAVAWQWIGKDRNPTCRYLPEDTILDIVRDIAARIGDADLITGHNIRKHDLPLINAMLLELGQAPLAPVLVSDTYADLKKRSPGFASQANLAEMLGVKAPKVGMSTVAWREANRLGAAGVDKTRLRVAGDVRQHIQMRKRLLELDWLKPPRMWKP